MFKENTIDQYIKMISGSNDIFMVLYVDIVLAYNDTDLFSEKNNWFFYPFSYKESWEALYYTGIQILHDCTVASLEYLKELIWIKFWRDSIINSISKNVTNGGIWQIEIGLNSINNYERDHNETSPLYVYFYTSVDGSLI